MRAAAVVPAVAVLAALPGCAVKGSGYRYLHSRSQGAYLKVPASWEVYDRERLFTALSVSEDVASIVPWYVTFDAAPKPKLRHFDELDTEATRPSGFLQVRRLDAQEASQLSNDVLRNSIVKVDQGMADGTVEVRRTRDVTMDGGRVTGQRLEYVVHLSDGGSFTVDQMALADQKSGTLYLLALGCGERCFTRYHREIDTVVGSWTIRKR